MTNEQDTIDTGNVADIFEFNLAAVELQIRQWLEQQRFCPADHGSGERIGQRSEEQSVVIPVDGDGGQYR